MPPRGEQLVVLVPRDPDGVAAELGPPRVVRLRVRQQQLAVARQQLEPDGGAGYRVELVLVDDLERAVRGDV